MAEIKPQVIEQTQTYQGEAPANDDWIDTMYRDRDIVENSRIQMLDRIQAGHDPEAVEKIQAARTGTELTEAGRHYLSDPEYHDLIQHDLQQLPRYKRFGKFVAQQWKTGGEVTQRGDLGWRMMNGYQPTEEEQAWIDAGFYEYDFDLGVASDLVAYTAETVRIGREVSRDPV